MLTGEETWCQLFSEPGAGSDLAGLVTRAELDGDEWVISGQKVWNTSAHHADLAMLVARTDWEVPKHKGLTYFVLPMRQPGVEARPLRQMNNHASFNEVFLTEARLPRDYVVGDVGEGWRVALTTLAFERRFGAMRRPRYANSAGRALEEARRESDAHFETYKWYPQRAGRVDLVDRPGPGHGHRVRSGGAAGDRPPPLDAAGQRLDGPTGPGGAGPGAHARSRGLHREAVDESGGPPGGQGSRPDCRCGRHAQWSRRALDGVIAEILVSVPAQSIAGGTDEIQRNILGERALGLPREPSVDVDRPFRDLLRNVSAGEAGEVEADGIGAESAQQASRFMTDVVRGPGAAWTPARRLGPTGGYR